MTYSSGEPSWGESDAPKASTPATISRARTTQPESVDVRAELIDVPIPQHSPSKQSSRPVEPDPGEIAQPSMPSRFDDAAADIELDDFEIPPIPFDDVLPERAPDTRPCEAPDDGLSGDDPAAEDVLEPADAFTALPPDDPWFNALPPDDPWDDRDSHDNRGNAHAEPDTPTGHRWTVREEPQPPEGTREPPVPERVLVVDGDAYTPAQMACMVTSQDCLLVATNNANHAKGWRHNPAFKGLSDRVIQKVPMKPQSADMTLAVLAGYMLGNRPALCDARWLFVARDHDFLMIQETLSSMGVPRDNMVQLHMTEVKPTHVQKHCSLQATGNHSPAPAAEPKAPAKNAAANKANGASTGAKKAKKKKRQGNTESLSVLAQEAAKGASSTLGIKNMHPAQLAKWMNQKATQNDQWHSRIKKALGGTGSVSYKRILKWVLRQPFQWKGEHIKA